MYRLFIAWRYLWSRLVSYVGVGLLALAVALFIVVMAVMEGMGEHLREGIRRYSAHVEVLAPAGPGISDWRELSETISKVDHVTGVTPYVAGVGTAESPAYRFACGVRGIDLGVERKEQRGLATYLEGKTFETNDGSGLPGALVGNRVEDRMDIVQGELVRLSVQRMDDADQTSRANFVITDGFKTDSLWLDNNMFISLEYAQKLFGTGDRVTGLGVWLDDIGRAHEVKRAIQRTLLDLDEEEWRLFDLLSSEPQSIETLAWRARIGPDRARELMARLQLRGAAREIARKPGHYVETTEPQVKTWAEQQPDTFSAIAHEAAIMRVILVIVIGFVSVLILCILWLMVEQKVRDIGILAALGARAGGVVSIFVLDGLFVGVVGTVIGMGLGTFVAWQVNIVVEIVDSIFRIDILPEEYFYGAVVVPHRILGSDLVLISVVAIACSVLASVPAALSAASADPIESLRHE